MATIFEKIVLSETEPLNPSVLWLRFTNDTKGLWWFGANGWEKLCDFNDGDNVTIDTINKALRQLGDRITILEEGSLVWNEA